MTLGHLDILIAFASVMLGISLLITVLTQTVSSLLSLRGNNLKRAVVDLIGTAHPTLSEHATDIAHRVLQHPLISDSAVQWYADLVDGRPKIKWLLGGLGGLVIGAISWPLTRMLAPESTYGLYVAIAIVLLAGAALVWLPDHWTLATAMRVEELIGILDKLSDGVTPPVVPPAIPPLPLPAGWTAAHSMAYIAQSARLATSPEVQALATQVQKLVGAVPVAAGPGAPQPTLSVSLDKVIQQIPTTVETKLDDMKSWFNGAMDRAKQRFTMHARIVTVMLSVVIAFGMHFDAFRLLKQLSTDAQLRTSLVNGANAMVKQAEKILPQQTELRTTTQTGTGVSPDSRPKTASSVPTTPPPSPDEQKPGQTGQSDIASLYTKSAKETTEAKALPESKAKILDNLTHQPTFSCREEALNWLQGKGILDGASDFNGRVDAKLQTEQRRLLDQAASVKCQLSQSGLQLVPTPYPGWNFENDNLLGILAAAALLGLGAPFWYNALKTMTSLRPLLAGKQEQETKK